jgi:hypothetical protein
MHVGLRASLRVVHLGGRPQGGASSPVCRDPLESVRSLRPPATVGIGAGRGSIDSSWGRMQLSALQGGTKPWRKEESEPGWTFVGGG